MIKRKQSDTLPLFVCLQSNAHYDCGETKKQGLKESNDEDADKI